MATSTPQRTYRAPCPGCGAPVEFKSAQSTHAVSAYCQSTVVRAGDTLQRIGKMAELFDDHSLLQLQASGTWQGQSFMLVGRLQYQYGEGTWTEWHALMADGSSAFLSEDNGAYVFTTPQPARELPQSERFQLGATTTINGQPFTVASNQQVALISAQGELPRLPDLGALHTLVELRSQSAQANAGQGANEGVGVAEVLSVDYSTQPPTLSRGQAVSLEDLHLSGLRDESAKVEQGRQFACPNCGAALTVQLANSKTLTCGACNSIIDLSQGIAGELQHALQDEPVQPLIALGSTGQLQGTAWQVVGFQRRLGTDPADPDEHFGWEEYLLYNAHRGFLFLVDSTEGWSIVKPATGAPVVSSNGQSATYLGTRYTLKESYTAQTSHVLGEFYWQVSRGQNTTHRDYASGRNQLSMEQSPQELTWSIGSGVNSDLIVKAFKLEDQKDLLKRSDVGPFTAASNPFLRPWVILFIVFVLLVLVLSRCARCDPAVERCSTAGGARTSGGSFGGYSGGGGHK